VEQRTVLISVVIVNYRVPDFLLRALDSLRNADLYEQTEIIVVDNASQDDSQNCIFAQFPEVNWIGLKNNIGFGKACNVGAQNAHGKFLLLLNPDTIVSKNTLSESVHFFETHSNAGIMGPKTLKPDGSLDAACRRSYPSPSVAFYRLTGLSKLFPKSKRFGQYNLTYLDPNLPTQVDAVSGSCMFLPLSLYREVGGFDERFFMYGEDLDLCSKVQEQGLAVWYNPATQIIHFKGKSSAKRSWKSRIAFYEAMIIFSKKHRHTHTAFLPGWLINIGVFGLASLNVCTSLFKTFTACFIDMLFVNTILAIGIFIRFSLSSTGNPYSQSRFAIMLLLHTALSTSFLVTFFIRGIYSKIRYSVSNLIMSSTVAALLFITIVFFINSLAFSRIAFFISAVASAIGLVAWRELLPRMTLGVQRILYNSGSVIIIGSGSVAAALIKKIEREKNSRIGGILWPVREQHPGEFCGYPVRGTMDAVKDFIAQENVETLIIATEQPWYSYVIEALSSVKTKNLAVLWVPPEIFTLPENQVPEIIPLKKFSV